MVKKNIALALLALIALPLFGCGGDSSSDASAAGSKDGSDITATSTFSVPSYEQNVSAVFEVDAFFAWDLLSTEKPYIFESFEDYQSFEEGVYEAIPEDNRDVGFESSLEPIKAHFEETNDYLFLVCENLNGSSNAGHGYVFEDDVLTSYTYYYCYVTTDMYAPVEVVAVSRDMVGDLSAVTFESLDLSVCDYCSWGYC